MAAKLTASEVRQIVDKLLKGAKPPQKFINKAFVGPREEALLLTNAIKTSAATVASNRSLNSAQAEAARKAAAAKNFRALKKSAPEKERKRVAREKAALEKKLKQREADYRKEVKRLADKVANTFNAAHKSNNKEGRDRTAKVMREMRASLQQKRRDAVLKAANITNYPWVAVTHGYAWPK